MWFYIISVYRPVISEMNLLMIMVMVMMMMMMMMGVIVIKMMWLGMENM